MTWQAFERLPDGDGWHRLASSEGETCDFWTRLVLWKLLVFSVVARDSRRPASTFGYCFR